MIYIKLKGLEFKVQIERKQIYNRQSTLKVDCDQDKVKSRSSLQHIVLVVARENGSDMGRQIAFNKTFCRATFILWHVPGPGCSKLTMSLVNISLEF